MKEVRFFVSGCSPAPGGSKSAFPIYKKHGLDPAVAEIPGWRPSVDRPCPTCGFTGRVAVSDAGGDNTKQWRQNVAAAAVQAMKQADSAPLTGPVEIEIEFRMPRPKHHYRSNGVQLKPGAPSWHITRPDCLKLARSTEDSMTGIVYLDDAQIVKESLEKAFSDQPGCWIVVKEFQSQ